MSPAHYVAHTESVETQISSLPLSWARSAIAVPKLDIVDLPYSSINWIPTAEIPQSLSFNQLFQDHLSKLENGFVLQNCNLELRDFLISKGNQAALMGAEAQLNLPLQPKRSLKALISRGLRHGAVKELPFNAANRQKFDLLLQHSAARQGQQLAFIERAEFDQSTRCFVFESNHQWLAAATLSSPSSKSFHTEMILRHKQSPNGVMEALISHIAINLAHEGQKVLSLGAVTPMPPSYSSELFSHHRHPQEQWLRSQTLFRLGRALNFAFNARGLWHFKNKFKPAWRPLYICATPSLTWATLAGIAHNTGYFKLIQSSLRSQLKTTLPLLPI
jgi:hypothetical protein